MKKIMMTGLLFMVMIWLIGCSFRGHRCSMVGCHRTAAFGSSHCRMHRNTVCVQAAPAGGEEEITSGTSQETLMALAGDR